jgi:hypothetical protein
VKDFMQRNGIEIFYQETSIANLSLKDSYAAFSEAMNCQREFGADLPFLDSAFARVEIARENRLADIVGLAELLDLRRLDRCRGRRHCGASPQTSERPWNIA